jgi:oxygen-independent coproporphyrinogen-3 oxidase
MKHAVRLGPSHFSLYELTIEEKTVFGAEFKNGKLKLEDEDTQTKMLLYARNFLKDNGYEHYELLNYARPGHRSKHNQIYWANEEYLGLGPGAYSFWNETRYQFADSVDSYMKKIARDDFKPEEQETLSPEKRETESLLLALRRLEGVDTRRFASVLERRKTEIERLEKEGLLSRKTGKIFLTDRGQLFAETVFSGLA